MISNALPRVSDATIRKSIVGSWLFGLRGLSESACDNNIKDGFTLLGIDYDIAEKLATESEPLLAAELVYDVGHIINELAGCGLLQSSDAMHVGIMGLRLGEAFPDVQCKLMDAMGQAAAKIKNHLRYESDREMPRVYADLVSRIRQQRSGRSPDRQAVSEKVDRTLADLGEPKSPPQRPFPYG